MRTLGVTTEGLLSRTERYVLNDICTDNEAIPIGTVICYLFAASERMEEPSITAKGNSGASANDSVFHMHDIPSLEDLNNQFRANDVHTWTVRASYQGVEIAVSGEPDSNEILISHPNNAKYKLDIVALLVHIEVLSWVTCGGSQEVLDLFRWIGTTMSAENPTMSYIVHLTERLKRQPDIYDEFVSCRRGDDGFEYPPEAKAIHEQGYTAEMLYETEPLAHFASHIGTYTYLAYLRENPKAALEDLQSGPPRE